MEYDDDLALNQQIAYGHTGSVLQPSFQNAQVDPGTRFVLVFDINLLLAPRRTGLLHTPVAHLSRGGTKKSRSDQTEDKENIMKVEIGSEQQMVEILREVEEAADSDDSDIIFVKSFVDAPRNVAEPKCTPKTEPESVPEDAPIVPVVVPFTALTVSGTKKPSPTSPVIDKETAADIEGMSYCYQCGV